MEDKQEYLPFGNGMTAEIYQPKHIATITICGSLHIKIHDDMNFIRPTEEQIKNLHDMLCIDVKLYDEGD